MPSAFTRFSDALRIRRAYPASAAAAASASPSKPNDDALVVDFDVFTSNPHSRAPQTLPTASAFKSRSAASTSAAQRSLQQSGPQLNLQLLSSVPTDDLETLQSPLYSEQTHDPLPPDYDPVTDPQSAPLCKPLNATHYQLNSEPVAISEAYHTLTKYCAFSSRATTQSPMSQLAFNLSDINGLFWTDVPPPNSSSANETGSILRPAIARPPTAAPLELFGPLTEVMNATDDMLTFTTSIDSGFLPSQYEDNTTSWFPSSTSTGGSAAAEQVLRWWALALIVFPLLTTFGNALVVYSVACERALRTTTNFFVGTIRYESESSGETRGHNYCIILCTSAAY